MVVRWRDVARGAIAGLLVGAVFVVGALLVLRVDILAAPVHDLLLNAVGPAAGSTLVITLVNGATEELFFRNTVVRHLPQLKYWQAAFAPVVLYVLVTAAMQVPLLAVAAIVIGVVAHGFGSVSNCLACCVGRGDVRGAPAAGLEHLAA